MASEDVRILTGVIGDLHDGVNTLVNLAVMSRSIRKALNVDHPIYAPITWNVIRSTLRAGAVQPEDTYSVHIPLRPLRNK